MDLWCFEEAHVQTIQEISAKMFETMIQDGMEVEFEPLNNMLFEMSISDEESWRQVLDHYICTEEPMECEPETITSIETKMFEEPIIITYEQQKSDVIVYEVAREQVPVNTYKVILPNFIMLAVFRNKFSVSPNFALCIIGNRNKLPNSKIQPHYMPQICNNSTILFSTFLKIKIYYYTKIEFVFIKITKHCNFSFYMEDILIDPSILMVSPLIYSF